MEIIGRIISKKGSSKSNKSKSKPKTRISELIREWFIRRGWRLSNSRRVVFRNASLYGVKDEVVDVKVFVSVEDGSAWCRYYGPDYTKEELKKLRDKGL